jgi:hypothetical protein
MPRKVFVAGEILTASDVNVNLMDQAVQVFDDATDRTTQLPSPTEGMVTYLKDVKQVQAFTGAAFTPVGGILQVVSVSTSTETSISSATFANITGLAATITPSSSSSKVLILVSLNIRVDTNSTDFQQADVRILRGSDVAEDFIRVATKARSNTQVVATHSLQRLDSPASTSAVTYQMQGKTNTGTVDFQNSNATSSITLMEVAG